MKKNLTKKLVLKKHTVASLNAEQLEALRGGNVSPTRPPYCLETCEPTCGNNSAECYSVFDFSCAC
jgi:natural product precursor